MSGRRSTLAAAIAAFVIVTALLAGHVGWLMELQVRDAAMRLLPRHAARATAIVAIDESSLRTSPWPWPRQKIAELIDRVAAAGAKGIVVDVLLAEGRDGDEQLARSLRRVPTVLVSAIDERGQWLLPASPLRESAVLAHGNFELDRDGIMRRLAATKQTHDRSLSAVCVEAASVMIPIKVPVGETIAPAFRTAPSAVPQVSAAALLASPSVAGILRGRIVFIGPTALALGDRVLTPVSDVLPDPGVTVHAAATESVVRRETIREIPPLAGGVISAFLVAIVIDRRSSHLSRLVKVIAVIAAILVGGAMLLATRGAAIPFVTMSSTVLLAAAAAETVAITAMFRQSHAATQRIETRLGMPAQAQADDVAPRLDRIALRLAELRAIEAESKRMLAHELKTPLASMRGLSQLLAGFSLSDAERTRVASLLETEAGKLQSMVTALLDLERLPLRDFEATSNVVDLGQIVRARVEFLQASTERPLKVSCEPDLLVRGDASLVERTVDNLVGNALKYTSGPVSISTRSVNETAVIDVEDEGPGLSDPDRERVFQRFFRGASAAGTQGLGLGLALVADVAHWHGGSASVHRSISGGSLFRVAFPRLSSFAKAGGL